MITESTIYWITRLDYIKNFISIVLLLSFFASFISIIFYQFHKEQSNNDWISDISKQEYRGYMNIFYKCFSVSIIIMIISLVIVLFVPTTKEICMIKVIPMIANSEAVDQLGKDGKEIYELGIKRIKEELAGDSK